MTTTKQQQLISLKTYAKHVIVCLQLSILDSERSEECIDLYTFNINIK